MSGMIKAKHQRLVLVVIAAICLLGAALLAIWALRSQASYFYVPSEFAANPPAEGQAVRLGGMVQNGSIKWLDDGVSISFVVGDGKARVPVRYTGILPDLFQEGSGVVAEGRLEGGAFVADNLLAKHDENYVPRELKDMSPQHAEAIVAETTQ